jgi:DNA polymerase (family 10)
MNFPLAQADRIAAKIVEALSPFCERIEVAGSIRRRRAMVGDVDVVALPRAWQLEQLRERARQSTTVVTDGPATRDFFSETPTNFGTLLLMRTGSREHNIYLVEHAKRMGLRWNPYHGVFDGFGKCLAVAEEAEIFRALGLAFVPPERRER